MKFEQKEPARTYQVGLKQQIKISDCGTMALAADEQITFITDQKNEYDVCRKSWGFYATPSLNGRLTNFDLRAVLIKNVARQVFFIFLVERGKESEFENYLEEEQLQIVTWLDNTENLIKIDQSFNHD